MNKPSRVIAGTVGGLATFALPCLLVSLDTGIAWSGGWRPDGWPATSVIAIAASGIVLSFAAVAIPKSRGAIAAKWPECLLLGMSLLLMLAVSEVVFRAVGPPPDPPHHLYLPNTQMAAQPDPSNPGGPQQPRRYTTNAMGIRGPELSDHDTLRILCIGGSTTHCIHNDDDRAWTHLLMTDLNAALPGQSVWSGSAGYPGYNTLNHLRFVREFEPFADFNIAFFLVGVNDLHFGLNWKKSLPARQRPAPAPLWTRNALYTYIQRAALIFALRNDPSVEDIHARNIEVRRQVRAKGKFVESFQISPVAVQMYRDNIRAIVEQCRLKGVTPVFATQPVLWADNLPESADGMMWMGMCKVGKAFLEVPALRVCMDRYNAALRETCAELSVECIDLSSMSGRIEYFVDDCHFSDAGSEALANIAAAYLSETVSQHESGRPVPQNARPAVE